MKMASGTASLSSNRARPWHACNVDVITAQADIVKEE